MLSGMPSGVLLLNVVPAVPACDTVTIWPPWIMMVPVRAGPGLSRPCSRRPGPVPTPLPITVIHGTVLHSHPVAGACGRPTVNAPAPPVAEACGWRRSVNVHPGCGAAAMTMPTPESRSTPGASMSSAVANSALLSCVCVKPGFCDLISAMIAAACGGGRRVPKNWPGKSPAPVTNTPSAAVRSGFCNTAPPVDEKLPGVTAVPSPRKKTRRGPSELNVSTDVARAERVRKRDSRAYAAATPNVKMLLVAACPCVCPAVATDNCPRLVFRCRKRPAAPVFFTIDDARARRAVAHLLVRIVVAVLDIRRARGDRRSRRRSAGRGRSRCPSRRADRTRRG